MDLEYSTTRTDKEKRAMWSRPLRSLQNEKVTFPWPLFLSATLDNLES